MPQLPGFATGASPDTRHREVEELTFHVEPEPNRYWYFSPRLDSFDLFENFETKKYARGHNKHELAYNGLQVRGSARTRLPTPFSTPTPLTPVVANTRSMVARCHWGAR